MAELIVIHLQDHQNKRALSRSSSWWDKFYIYCTELYTELLKKIELPVMNMANRAITRTFTDSNCFSYLLSLSLSLQCLVVSLKVPSSCTSLISGFFFIEKPLTRGLCLLNFPQSPLLKIVNLASLLFPIPPGCPRVLSQGKADDHDMCIRQPFSLIIIFQAPI